MATARVACRGKTVVTAPCAVASMAMIATIEKMASLQAKGILAPQEFGAKSALCRINA